MKKVLVVIGSARKGRAADGVANIVKEELTKLNVEPVMADLKKLDLPFFDDAKTPSEEDFEFKYEQAKRWSDMVKDSDGVVLLTPEYNHGTSGILKNAIDWLYPEWKDKPVTIVGYGWSGAPFATKHLVDIMQKVGAKLTSDQAGLSFSKEIDTEGNILDEEVSKEAFQKVLEELVKSTS